MAAAMEREFGLNVFQSFSISPNWIYNVSVKTGGQVLNRKFVFIEVRSRGRKARWEAAGKEI